MLNNCLLCRSLRRVVYVPIKLSWPWMTFKNQWDVLLVLSSSREMAYSSKSILLSRYQQFSRTVTACIILVWGPLLHWSISHGRGSQLDDQNYCFTESVHVSGFIHATFSWENKVFSGQKGGEGISEKPAQQQAEAVAAQAATRTRTAITADY